MNTYKNPIIPGFYPDPSVCRVGDDYYLVTSTFTYFPGVPIFHSTDLVNWKQIGNVLDRPSQIPLTEGHFSTGIFAPTLRYHEGTYYMITTNVANGGNFIVRAKDPAGPWSEPYWLDSKGIDPSLLFDDDGKCYYCGATTRREGGAYPGDNEIYVQELDLDSMKLIGESVAIWHGADKKALWVEGPHIYKKEGWYYLMISEGGTDYEHAVTIARSKEVFGYYEGHICNPIISHRHLGRSYPIVNTGHGDLVETQNGQWWMVLLASRPYGGYYRNLGRETFLTPLIWEDGWPVINPGKGCVEDEGLLPILPFSGNFPVDETEHFDKDSLPHHFIYSRNPVDANYDLEARESHLRLKLSPVALSDLKSPTYVGRRQQSKSYTVSTQISFEPGDGEQAGLALIQSNEFYYSFYMTSNGGKLSVEVAKCYDGKTEVVASYNGINENDSYILKVCAREQSVDFEIKDQVNDSYIKVAENIDGRMLSVDVAGGFVGTSLGMFASSCGQETENYAYFDWFRLSCVSPTITSR